MGKREEEGRRDLRDSRLDGLMQHAFGSRRPRDGDSVVDFVERSTGVRARVMLRDDPDEHSPLLRVKGSGPDTADDDSRYHVVGEIARGGVGVVFKGRDTELGRDVAIKVLRKDVADHPGIVQRFVEEAQIEGQLQHPGIIPVYGLGLQPDGRPYFAMKLVKGRTLGALLKERTDPATDRRRYLGMFEQICQAMAYAHARGVIHRDLKPSNILVGGFGEVLVVDWGFAKVLDRGDESEGPARLPLTTVVATIRSQEGSSHSLAGSVMGTPAYMPPEQALGHVEHLDERSDVFSLGAVLTELLTGEPPYVGETKDQLVMAAQAALEEAHARLDSCGAEEALVALARRCLSPKSADRPVHAGIVATELSDWMTETEERARRAELSAIEERAALARERQRTIWERKARRRVVLGAAAVLVAVLVGAGSLLWMAGRRADRREQSSRRVAEAMDRAIVHRAAGRWGEAVAEAKGAVELAAAEENRAAANVLLATVTEEQAAAEKSEEQRRRDEKLLTRLEEIRHFGLGQRSVNLEPELQRRKWASTLQALRDWGVDLESQTTKEIVAALSESPEKLVIAERLSGRAFGGPLDVDDRSAVRAKVGAIASALDPDPLRERMWEARRRRDRDEILDVVRSVNVEELGPYQAVVLSNGLEVCEEREQSIRLLMRAAELWPDDYWLNMLLGIRLYVSERNEEAIRWVVAALAIRPDSALAWGVLGSLTTNCGRPEEALPLFERSLARFDGDPVTLEHYGLTLMRLGRVRESIESYDRALEVLPATTSALWNRACAWNKLEEWDRCLDDCKRIAAIDPSDARPHHFMGAIYRSHKGQPQASLAACARAIELDPGDWMNHMNRGNALLDLRRYADAAGAFRQVCRLRPDWGFARARVSFALRMIGRYRAALEIIEEGCELDPRDPGIRDERAMVLAGLGRNREAVREARAAVDLDPSFGPALFTLATSLASLERYDQAIYRCDEAMDALEPDHPFQDDLLKTRRDCVVKRDLIGRLDEILAEPGSIRDPDELEALVYICYGRDRFLAAAGFARRHLEALGPSAPPVYHRNLAGIAISAGTGKGVDATDDATVRKRWRDVALRHLRKLLDLARAGDRLTVYLLGSTREDEDFVLLRDGSEFENLTEGEQDDWQQLRDDIHAFFGGK